MNARAATARLALSASVIAFAAVGMPLSASAATCNWNTAAGIWNSLTNWSCGAVPGSSDAVTISTAGGAVTLTGAVGQVSTLALASANTLNVSGTDLLITGGTLTNNGTMTFGTSSRLRASGTLNIGGTGTIILDNSGGFARIGEFGGNFVFGAGQTLRGSGEVGFNSATFTNNGLMSADVAGAMLLLDPAGGSGTTSVVNTGTLQATSGGTLFFGGGGYDNSAGAIRAISSGTVTIGSDARVIGGTLNNNTGGVLNTASGGTSYFQNVTVGSGSKLTMGSGSDVLINGALTVNGTFATAGSTRLRAEGGSVVTLNGSGDILLDNSAGYARLGEFGGDFTFGSALTVHGRGEIGFNSASFTNNGLVSADVTGATLLLDSAGGSGTTSFINKNVLEATNGATLFFGGGGYDNSAGTIRALSSGIVTIGNDARIIGGTLSSATGGSITTQSGGTEYLQNVTLGAGTALNVGSSSDVLINNVLTNNGTLVLGGSTRLRAEAAGVVTINGTGNIVLDNSGGYARIGEFGGTFIFGSNQSVFGSGEIGFNSALIANNNVFSFSAGSNVAIDAAGGSGGVGGGLGIDGDAALLNNGSIIANNSIARFFGGRYDNRPGTINAINGGMIEIGSDARIIGGTLNSNTGGAITTAAGGTSYLQNTTLSAGSNLNMGSSSDVLVNGALTVNGTFALGSATRLRAEAAGAAFFNGTGDIVLDNSGGYSRIGEFGGAFTFGSALTVHGRGEIGFNSANFVNNGLVLADVSGATLVLDTAGGNGSTTFINNSVLQAKSGATLFFGGGGYDNSAGTIRAISSGIVTIGSDARIIGGMLTSNTGGVLNTAVGSNSFLQNTTLSAGSSLTLGSSSDVQLNGVLTLDGTLNAAAATRIRAEGGSAVTINGSGDLRLDNSGGYSRVGEFGGNFTFGSALTVHGAGEIGFNSSVFTNNGFISADGGGGILIDAAGGSGGLSGSGVGTGNNAGLVNTGVIQAIGGKTLAFGGGLYENGGAGLGGELYADAGSTLAFNSDASFFNLKAGGVLDAGRLYASSTGAAATINLRSNAANSLVTIGTASGPATNVILQGSGSVVEVTPFGGGAPVTIDQTLTGIAASGVFSLDSRNFTVAAGGGGFSNAGLHFVGNSIFGSSSYTNSGAIIADGTSTITAPITNSGTVHVASGTLNTQAITGSTGTILTDNGATLNMGGNATAGFLTNNGTLTLGTRNVVVTSDYQNDSFGSGNAFAAHNSVTGTGLINATSATMDPSGPAFSGGILDVGNVRTGGSSSTTLTITNNGTATTLRGAVQNILAPSVALTSADWAIGPGGGSTTVTISYTGSAAGSLSGQTLNVVNNFDNVADQSIGLAGNIYQVAQAGSLPTTLTLGARRVGDAAATTGFSIANVAPLTPGFNENLNAVGSVGSGFTLNGSGTVTVAALGAGSSAPVTLSHGTTTAGAYSSTVSIANTSLAVASSGLSDLALTGQSIAVSSNVYAAALASLSGTTVNFGTIRKNAASPMGSVTITNAATGALTDSLVTTTSGLPSGVTATAIPGPLGAEVSGNATFSLNTTTAGVVSGSGLLNFVSHDSELADLALASQSVGFTGTVTDLASAALFKNAGLGAFAGSGTAFTLDLGSLSTNSGVFATDLGVINLVVPSAFAELLGGSFTQGAGAGYSFAGNSFTGVAGGMSNLGNLLSFDTTGLSSGTYTKQVTFNGFSRFAGLSDLSLTPINVNITATVTGGAVGGAVPEPATWMMLLVGFGLVGSALRRNRLAVAQQLV